MSTTSAPSTPSRWTLRDLPLAARLTLATFLISVGIGYFSALVQLHFQHSTPGELMPTPQNSIDTFHGKKGKSPLVQLILANEALPFNGTGQMSAAFTTRSTRPGWKTAIANKAKEMNKLDEQDPDDKQLALAEKEVRKEREGEKKILVAWLEAGADESVYEKDRFPLSAELTKQPLTKKFVQQDGDEKFVKLKTLWTERCVRCHSPGGDPKAEQFPLETVAQFATKYNSAGERTPMSLTKLAQTTHVHLLGFSMLYGLTGLIFALTGFPGFFRLLLAPLPLLAQVADISFWWLARLDEPHGPMFATWIPISGGIVGASLGLQILLSLFGLFGTVGRVILVLLAVAVGGGGVLVKEHVIDPHIAGEREAISATK